jgi:hypothetical protein
MGLKLVRIVAPRMKAWGNEQYGWIVIRRYAKIEDMGEC